LLRAAAVAFALGSASAARADFLHPDHDHAGLVPGIGLGAAYANAGLQLVYLQPVRPGRWTVFAGAAFGIIGGSSARTAVDRQDHDLFGAAFTLGGSFGNRARLCADAGWGALGSQTVDIEGISIDAVAHYGIFGELGFEFLGYSGLYLRVMPLGLGYVPSRLVESSQRVNWTGSVGVGRKLW
jgi:hypothetical protein